MNKHLYLLLLTLAVGFSMTGCVVHETVAEQESEMIEFPPHKLVTSTGYGTVDKTKDFSKSQMKLMAMRASKMDAYRILVEQIYGIQIDGSTTVENMVVKHDSYRGFIHAYLRGAKVKRSTLLSPDDFTYETVMEIDLTPRFFECLKGKAIYNQCI